MAVGEALTDAGKRLEAEQILALSAERIDVSIREVVTGEVEVSTITHLRDVQIDEALSSHHAHVERVAVGRVIDAMPDVREEDGVFIIPVVEEIVVVEKRLFLKEEVRIRREMSTHRYQETVAVREQEAVIRRKPAAVTPNAGHVGGAPITPKEITS